MIFQNYLASEVPQDYPRFDDSLETQRTPYIVVLVTKIYYCERIQNKIDKRKRYVGPSLEKMRLKFPKALFPVKSHRTCFIPTAASYDKTCRVFSTRELIRNYQRQGFYWGLLRRLCLIHTEIPDSQKERRSSA